jgi:MOSC domain-containing protein YiiM
VEIKRQYEIRVLSVNISHRKGTAKFPVASIEVDCEGVAQDAHRGTKGRNVSLLDRSLVDKLVEESDIESIPAGAMGENITFRIEGQDSPKPGDLIRFDEVILKVAKIGKECHGGGCEIFRSIGRCVMPSAGIFCSVINGGIIEAGMTGEPYSS